MRQLSLGVIALLLGWVGAEGLAQVRIPVKCVEDSNAELQSFFAPRKQTIGSDRNLIHLNYSA